MYTTLESHFTKQFLTFYFGTIYTAHTYTYTILICNVNYKGKTRQTIFQGPFLN